MTNFHFAKHKRFSYKKIAQKTPYHNFFIIKKKDLGVFLLYKYTTNDNRKSAKKRFFICM
jgi:hypothetical protein